MTALPNVARLASAQQQSAERVEPIRHEPWPVVPEEAFHGLAGRYVRKLEAHTEADPVGVLVQLLVMFGNLIGRRPHFRVEADEHSLNLFTVLVGESAKGRKGVSGGQAKRLLRDIDPEWYEERLQDGLSSGEGLIWAVRDPIEKIEAVREKGRATGETQTVLVDAGVEDKRLLVFEAEFAATLRVLGREGNNLSPVLRKAWDDGSLRTLTKNSPAKASGAHVSIVGHITKTELLRYLDSTEAANGFGNRFLWCCVRRSKYLPQGGAAHTLDFGPESAALGACVAFARQTAEMRRDAEADTIWERVYFDLSEGKPGLLGAMIGRAEPQTMRLACLYALLDRSAFVRAEHLLAALALWDYCEQSARWIFGDALGDPIADEILRALCASPEGLTRNEIGDLFSRHRRKGEIGRALAQLLASGLATSEKEPTAGRPIERWLARSQGSRGREKSAESEISP